MPVIRTLAVAAAIALGALAAERTVSPQAAHAQDAVPGTVDPKTRGAELSKRGIDAFARQQFAEAEEHWMAALAAFEQADDPVERANTLRNLTFLPRLSIDDRVTLLEEALALVRHAGNPHVEGLVRVQMADFDFIRGDYASATANVDLAIALLQQHARSQVALARALVSRGRLQRSMNRTSAAIQDQQRAAALLESAGDLAGAAQAHHGVAVTLLWQGEPARAAEVFGQAIALARRSGNQRQLSAALMQAAIAAQRAGRPDEALAMLHEAEALVLVEDRATLDGNWGHVLLALDRAEEALARLDRALAAGDGAAAESRFHWLSDRAEALDRLGRREEALEESSRAVALIESVRARLVQEDDAKRGYAETRRKALAAHVARLAAVGRSDEALEAAERARARAFLDLLATTDLRASAPPPPPSVSSLIADGEPAPAGKPSVTPTTRGPSGLDSLVTARRGTAPRTPARREPDISSVAVVEPPTLASIKAVAARLGSQVVSYWVTSDRTFIWVVSPDGRVSHAASNVGERRLASLVERTFAEVGGPTRGGTLRQSSPRPSSPTASRLAFGNGAARAYRDLYALLVEPIRPNLPTGGLVTIVPHGPLFRLAFAALTAPSGRYLVEEFPLHFAPSASTLEFTSRRRPHASGAALVVADPAIDPALGGDEPLVRLPGAAREGRHIAEILGPGRARLLQGSAATEPGVRAAAPSAHVLHFATHGIIRDDHPFESFLALAGPAAAASDDGRLTMGEVYGLRLNADLVVLSACRSAAGPVTGDGIVGLTRGFFSAGTPSVIASLWDVPDSVTASVFPAFYREWTGERSKAAALRASQLAMIRDLRAGRVAVDTPAGRFVLPEHPALWAGLVLVGEP